MWEILTFERFVTQDILIFFYYTGVLALPLTLFAFRKYFEDRVSYLQKKENKLKTILLFFLFFLSMELALRMVFEFMIAYFDIHDYLYAISQK